MSIFQNPIISFNSVERLQTSNLLILWFYTDIRSLHTKLFNILPSLSNRQIYQFSFKSIGSVHFKSEGNKSWFLMWPSSSVDKLLDASSGFKREPLRFWSFIWPRGHSTIEKDLWLRTRSPMWLSVITCSTSGAYTWLLHHKNKSTVVLLCWSAITGCRRMWHLASWLRLFQPPD